MLEMVRHYFGRQCEKMTNFDEIKQRYNLRGVNPDRLRVLKEQGGDTILDVGCGSGAYVFKLKNEKKIEGVDYQEFDSWKESPSSFKVSVATDLPYADNSFDTLACFETLEHLRDPSKALREFYRVARHNIIVTVPNCTVPDVFLQSNLIYSHWNDPTHVNFFKEMSLINLVEDNGFNVKTLEYINMVRVDKMLRGLMSNETFFKKLLFETFLLRNLVKNNVFYITLLLVARKS